MKNNKVTFSLKTKFPFENLAGKQVVEEINIIQIMNTEIILQNLQKKQLMN